MARFNKITFSTGTTATDIKNYFEGLDDRFVCTVSGSQITIVIADAVTIVFNVETSYWRNPFTITVNSTTESNNIQYGAKTVITIIDDNLIYLHFCDESGRRITILYENINGVDYAGYKGSQGNSMSQPFSNFTIDAFSIYKVGDTTTNYAHTAALNYACSDANTIEYLAADILKNGTTKIETDENLIACSTVTAGSVVSMENGNNYFAAGANSLIPIN